MNWDIILTSAGLSTVVNAGLAILLYRSQKRVDFDYDYKKYIIKKRIEAYDKVQTAMNQIGVSTQKGTGEKCYHFFIVDDEDAEPISRFNAILTAVTASERFWLSSDLTLAIKELVEKARQAIKELGHGENINKEQYRGYGVLHHQEFSKLIAVVRSQWFEDLKKLNDIEKFIITR